MNSTSLRVISYARVSKANKHGETVSVDQQQAGLRARIEALGHVLVAEHSDRAVRASGAAKHRPGWDAVLTSIGTGEADALALWEVSRGSRRLRETAELIDAAAAKGMWIITPSRVYDTTDADDRMTLGIGAVMSEREAAATSARIRRDVAAKAREGRPHGREVYGYRRIYSPATGALVGVEVHPEEAAVVRRLVDGVLAGTGLRTLGRALDDEGILCPSDAIAARRGREPKGHTWTGRVIRETVTRRAYLGIREHTTSTARGTTITEYAAQWPAIITEAEHVRLVSILSDPARWTRTDDGGQPVVQHWLSGTLRCGKPGCGSRMRRYRQSGGQEAYACQDSRCRGCSVNLEAVESVIGRIIVARLSRADGIDALTPIDHTATDLSAARAALAEAEAEREEAARMLKAGTLSLAGFAAADAAIEARIEAARSKLRAVETPGLPAFATDAPDPAAAWADWTPAQRHAVARALFDRVEVKPLGRTGRPRKAATVEETLLPRLGFVRVGTVEPVWGM